MTFNIDALILQPLNAIFGDGAQGFLFQPAVGGDPFYVDGVFDEAYVEVDPANGMPVNMEQPVLGVRDADFTSQGKALPLQGDTLTRVSTNRQYQVREPRTDSHGHTKLMLNFIGN